jgi:hypothetical protein
MELFGIATIPYPQDFYDNYNVCKIAMGQWEELVEYCDSNLVLLFKTKPVKRANAPIMRMLMQMEMDSILHLCVIVSALQKRRNVITKRRRSKSTMAANMFNFLPSGITKDTSTMFWERLLSKCNYLQGQVLHQRVHYQCVHPLKIKSSKGSWLLKQ